MGFPQHSQNAIPDDGKNYVEGWRRDVFNYDYLKRGWSRIEESGQAEEWVRDVGTEEEWADLKKQVDTWQKNWERENGVRFVANLGVRN